MNIVQTIIERPYYNLTINHRENDEDDMAVIREMFEQNVYRFEAYKLEQDRPIILDIGANIGTFTLLALKSAQEAGVAVTIYAVEPEPDNLTLLMRNLNDNPDLFSGGSTVTVLESGISDFVGSAGITSRSGSSRLSAEDGLHQIDVITFDKLLKDNSIERIDFTKIDIEGSEIPLIMSSSLKSLLLSHFYAIEFDRLDSKDDFLSILRPFLDDFSFDTWGIPANGCNLYLENHHWSQK